MGYDLDTTIKFQEGIYDYNLLLYARRQVIDWDTISASSGVEKVRLHVKNNLAFPVRVKPAYLWSSGLELGNDPSKSLVTVLPDSSFILRVKFTEILGRDSDSRSISYVREGGGGGSMRILMTWIIVEDEQPTVVKQVHHVEHQFETDTVSGDQGMAFKAGVFEYDWILSEGDINFDWGMLYQNSGIEKVIFKLHNPTEKPLVIKQIKNKGDGIVLNGNLPLTIPPNSVAELNADLNFTGRFGELKSKSIIQFRVGQTKQKCRVYHIGALSPQQIEAGHPVVLRFSPDQIPNVNQPFRYNGEKVNVLNKNGLKEGVWVDFYANGWTKSIKHYKNGQLSGLQYHYHSNGALERINDLNLPIDSYFDLSGKLSQEFTADSKTDYYQNGNVKRIEKEKSITFYATNGDLLGVKKQGRSQVLNNYELTAESSFYPNGFPKMEKFTNGKTVYYSDTSWKCRTQMFDPTYQYGIRIFTYENCDLIAIENSRVLNDRRRRPFRKYVGTFSNDTLVNGYIEQYSKTGEYRYRQEVKNRKELTTIWLDGIRYNYTDSLGKRQGEWISNHPHSSSWSNGNEDIIYVRRFFKNDTIADTTFHYRKTGEVETIYLIYKNETEPVQIDYTQSGNIWRESYSFKFHSYTIPYQKLIYHNDESHRIKLAYRNGYTYLYENGRITSRRSPYYNREARLDDEAPHDYSGSSSNRSSYFSHTLSTGQFRGDYIYNGKMQWFNQDEVAIKTAKVVNGKVDGDRILVIKDRGLRMDLEKKGSAYDRDRNGYITRSEAARVINLSITGKGVRSVSDLSYFPNMDRLIVNGYEVDVRLQSMPDSLLRQIQIYAGKTTKRPSRNRYSGYPWEEPPIEPIYPFKKVVDNTIYDFVEVAPSFPGGIEQFSAYIEKECNYPKFSIDLKSQGTVYISFVVNQDGSIEQIKIRRGVDDAIDKEAIRLLKASPKWIPGQIRGRDVRVRVTFPMRFELPR